MLPTITQISDTYQGQSVTVTKVEVDGEATLRLKDGLITDGTYIYRMIARADQAREVVVSIGNISVSYSLSAVYETFSQSYMSVVADSHPCVTIIFPTGTYYLYQVELDGNSVSSDLLEHIEEVSTKTDEAYEKAYQAMPKYTTCSSAGSATAKVTASITNFDTSLPAGMRVSVLMREANLAVNPTLSVSNTPAYPILTSSGEAITADNLSQVSWPQNALVTFVFDGNNWRIDDSAALTKIDHILTENIVGDNGWINLKDGVFNYGNGKLTWDGSAFSATGEIHATGGSIDGDMNVSGTFHGAKIDGESIDISAEGDIDYDADVTAADKALFGDATSYHTFVQTVEQQHQFDDMSIATYKGVRIQSYFYNDDNDTYTQRIWVDVDPYKGVQIWRPSGSSPSPYPALRLGGVNPDEGVDLGAIGDVIGSTGGGSYTAVSVANETWTTLVELTFTPGIYVVKMSARFAKNATGDRFIRMNRDSSTYVWDYACNRALSDSDQFTYVHLNTFVQVDTTTTFYFQAWQNSTKTLSVTPRFGAVCIKRYWTPDILTGGSGNG